MTPRSLWTILIKCFGIFTLLNCLTVIPQSISSILVIGQNFDDSGGQSLAIAIIIIIFTISLYLTGTYIFLFKTDWIIDKLSLEKHFREDKFELNVHRSTILQIAIIVIGGQIFVTSLPQFCRQVFSFYQQKSIFRENANAGLLIYQFAELTIGYLLMTNSRRLTAFIERKRRNNNA